MWSQVNIGITFPWVNSPVRTVSGSSVRREGAVYGSLSHIHVTQFKSKCRKFEKWQIKLVAYLKLGNLSIWSSRCLIFVSNAWTKECSRVLRVRKSQLSRAILRRITLCNNDATRDIFRARKSSASFLSMNLLRALDLPRTVKPRTRGAMWEVDSTRPRKEGKFSAVTSISEKRW